MRSMQAPKRAFITGSPREDETELPHFSITAPVFETGIHTIDIQHRMLMGRLEALERLVGFPSATFACQSLENFANLAMKHLADEKRLLEHVNYPELEALEGEHEWEIIGLQRMCEEFCRSDLTQLPTAIDSMWQWTIEHIIESDTRHMPFLTRSIAWCAQTTLYGPFGNAVMQDALAARAGRRTFLNPLPVA